MTGCWWADVQLRVPRGEPLTTSPLEGAVWASRGPAFSACETTQIEDLPGVGGRGERELGVCLKLIRETLYWWVFLF